MGKSAKSTRMPRTSKPVNLSANGSGKKNGVFDKKKVRDRKLSKAKAAASFQDRKKKDDNSNNDD